MIAVGVTASTVTPRVEPRVVAFAVTLSRVLCTAAAAAMSSSSTVTWRAMEPPTSATRTAESGTRQRIANASRTAVSLNVSMVPAT
eukprot:4509368-Prymnesium_polylepis.1